MPLTGSAVPSRVEVCWGQSCSVCTALSARLSACLSVCHRPQAPCPWQLQPDSASPRICTQLSAGGRTTGRLRSGAGLQTAPCCCCCRQHSSPQQNSRQQNSGRHNSSTESSARHTSSTSSRLGRRPQHVNPPCAEAPSAAQPPCGGPGTGWAGSVCCGRVGADAHHTREAARVFGSDAVERQQQQQQTAAA